LYAEKIVATLVVTISMRGRKYQCILVEVSNLNQKVSCINTTGIWHVFLYTECVPSEEECVGHHSYRRLCAQNQMFTHVPRIDVLSVR
jgi:hypothetical protein